MPFGTSTVLNTYFFASLNDAHRVGYRTYIGEGLSSLFKVALTIGTAEPKTMSFNNIQLRFGLD